MGAGISIRVASAADVKHFRVRAVRDDVRAQHLQKAGVPLDLVTVLALQRKSLLQRLTSRPAQHPCGKPCNRTTRNDSYHARLVAQQRHSGNRGQ